MIKVLFAMTAAGVMIWFIWQTVVTDEQPVTQVESGQPSDEAVAEEVTGLEDQVSASRSSVLSEYFPVRSPMTINDIAVEASIARTETERKLGLSGTPRLPVGVVKLFVFTKDTEHGFWMKDMNYPIDIVWVNVDNTIVHIETEVSPDSYPKIFRPDAPARYVIETAAGFMSENNIVVGDTVELPKSLRN